MRKFVVLEKFFWSLKKIITTFLQTFHVFREDQGSPVSYRRSRFWLMLQRKGLPLAAFIVGWPVGKAVGKSDRWGKPVKDISSFLQAPESGSKYSGTQCHATLLYFCLDLQHVPCFYWKCQLAWGKASFVRVKPSHRSLQLYFTPWETTALAHRSSRLLSWAEARFPSQDLICA